MKEIYETGYIIFVLMAISTVLFLWIGDIIKLSYEWVNDDSTFHETFLGKYLPFDLCQNDIWLQYTIYLLWIVLPFLLGFLWPVFTLGLLVFSFLHFARFIVRLKKSVDKISVSKLSEKKYESYDPEFVKWKEEKGI
jgi:hypothetical protein